MFKFRVTIALLAFATSCTSSQTAQIPLVPATDVAKSSKLQLAVGTATIGVANGQSVLGLNVVATFRSKDGNNATNTNTPVITAPTGFSFGPLLGGSNVLSGFSTKDYVNLESAIISGQNQQQTLIRLAQGLGPFIGVFGYGLAADNQFSIDDSRIQSSLSGLPGEESNTYCEGLAYPGYFNNGNGTATPPGAAVNRIPPYGSLPGIYYGGYAAALGQFPVNTLPTFSAITELERSAELALPIPSGDGGGSTSCTCPQTCAPIETPLYNAAFPIQAFGGPPAWPSPQGYGNYQYFVGYPTGFTDFASTPAAGTYSMSVSYPTSTDYQSTASLTVDTQLTNVSGLGVLTTPKLAINSDGSGLLTGWSIPAGVQETIVFIATPDCDLSGRDLKTGGGNFNHYSFLVRSSGPQAPIFVAPNLGPPALATGAPTHTFCATSDLAAEQAALAAVGAPTVVINTFVAQVQAIGFDYPAYESSYPFTMSQTPTIRNSAGQADVTTSYPNYLAFTVPLPSTTGMNNH